MGMFDFFRGRIGLIRGGKYPHCHTVVVDDDRRAFIDASSDRDKLLALDGELEVDIILTSHAHEDHMLYNSLFPHAALFVHAQDEEPFRDIRALNAQYGLSPEEALFWEDFLVKECTYVPRKPDRLLAGGDTIDFGRTRARVIHTPGHTPGHCCLHFPDEGLLYLADYDLARSGPYYADVCSSIEDTLRSLDLLAAIDAETFLTAHGEGVFDASPDLIRTYRDTIYRREERLLDLLKKGPRTLDEITAACIVYGKPRTIGAWDLSLSERMMMKKHLERLVGLGRVSAGDGRFSLAG